MTDGSRTTFRIALAGIIALIVGIQLRPYLLWTPAELTARGFLVDDAFFYSVLAGNYWRAGFLTFDGHMATNGVQPLWMGVQIALAGVFAGVETTTILARSTWVMYVAFSFLTIWFVARGSILAATVRSALITGLLLLNPQFQLMVVQGLETSLFLVLMVVVLLLSDAWLGVEPGESRRSLSTTRVVLMAAAASACFLARTDFFWIFIIIGLLIAWRAERPARALATFAIAGGALIGPYLLNNLWTHGALMPISGRVKLFYLNSFLPDRASYMNSDEWRAFFYALPSLLQLPATTALSTRVAATLALLVAGLVIVWRLHRTQRLPASLAMLSWVVVGHLLFMHLGYRELREYTSYYFAAETWWLAVGFAIWMTPSTRHATKLASVLAVAIVSLAGWQWATRTTEPSIYWVQRMNLAEDIRKLPPGAKVGAFWPGCFAAFSGRDLAPLDGIVGSNDYFQRYIQPGREFDFIREQQIEYIAIYLPEAPSVILSRAEPPGLSFWSYLGVQRLWENRHLKISVAAQRTFGSDVGWYLLRLGH